MTNKSNYQFAETNIYNNFLFTKYKIKEIKMKHNIGKYIILKLQESKWQDKKLAERSGLSTGQISKLKNGNVTRLSAHTFFLIVKAFNDSIPNAIKTVFPNGEFKLKAWNPKIRNSFGQTMQEYELQKNSLQEISYKTGIKEVRLNELYYRNGAVEAYELILIEKAISEKTGTLFNKLFEKLC